jgi:hypothetical protein
MKEILKLLLAFAPWIAFLLISGGSMLRLQIGILVAAVLVVIMGVTKLHRGAVLWAGYIFFAFALIFVVWLKNPWVIHHMGILASGTLFAAAQLSIVMGHPFTEDYARENVPNEAWNSASFLRGCYTTTSFWSCIFLFNTLLNVIKTYQSGTSEVLIRTLEYTALFTGIAFTRIYAALAGKKRAGQQKNSPKV